MNKTLGFSFLCICLGALPMCNLDASPATRTAALEEGEKEEKGEKGENEEKGDEGGEEDCDDPHPECDECKGGVIELTLRYIEAVDAPIIIESGKEVYDIGVVSPNQEFTITGTKKDGKFDKNNLEITINGVEQDSEIHVSCSQPIGPGMVFGALEVVSAVSKDNGPVCPAPDCLWCGTEDDDADGVGFLALRYTGAGGMVSIHNGKKSSDPVLFEGIVSDGDLVELHAANVDKDKLKSEITFLDGGGDKLLGIHTSCSKPLVPGTVYSTTLGDFELVAGADKNQMALCPLTPECHECGFGEFGASGIRSVDLLYSGTETFVGITNLNNPTPLFAGDVSDGDIITVSAQTVEEPILASLLTFHVTNNWLWAGNLTTDCTASFGPGKSLITAMGQFIVIAAEAQDGVDLCPHDSDS